MTNFARIMGLLFGSVGAHTYTKFEQVAPPPPSPRIRYAEFSKLKSVLISRSSSQEYPNTKFQENEEKVQKLQVSKRTC